MSINACAGERVRTLLSEAGAVLSEGNMCRKPGV